MARTQKISSFPRIPKVSEYTSRKEWEQAVWDMLVSNKAKGADLFLTLFTPFERRAMVHRIAAVDRIASGVSYREIGNELWLSPQTISAIKKAISEKKYRSYWERSKTERKAKVYSESPSDKERRRTYGKRRWKTKYGTFYVNS